MSNFFDTVIIKDSRSKSTGRISDIGLLEPVTRVAVQGIIEDARTQGIHLMVFETFRSKQRQEKLYYEGASKLKNVGVHHYGLACDIVKNINGQPSWSGSFDFLGKLARKHGLIWGGDWGTPSKPHSFIDSCHVQRCPVGRQSSLFSGSWYPSDSYNPYDDLNAIPALESMILEEDEALSQNLLTKINLVIHENYEGDRLEKLKAALNKVELVLNSEAFKQQVLEFTYKGEKTFYYRRSLFGRPIDTPYTNDQVYNMIMTAEENPGNINRHSIDLYLKLINGDDGNVVGYGNFGAKEIYTYSTMFDQMEVDELANHYVHEWCHKLGFNHATLPSGKRSKSVPYAIGNIVEELVGPENECMH